MQLALENGNALLRVPEKQLFGWLTLSELTLKIPQKFLSDSTAEQNIQNYKRIRTMVLSAQLVLAQGHVDAYVDSLAPTLASAGIDRLQIRSRQGYYELSARIREATRFADLSARLYLSVQQDRLRISCSDSRVYGYLETPAPVIAHRLLAQLFRVGDQNITEVLALGDFSLRPLAAALTHFLPACGWRLPNQSRLRISSIKHTLSGLKITLGSDLQASPNSAETATLLDSLERFQNSDRLMLEGRLEDALSGYRTQLAARGNDDAFLGERILSIAAASRAHFAEGLELARQSLGQQPDFAPAHAAIAAIYVAQAKVERAAARYQKLCLDAQRAGDEEECVRASLACARLMRQYAADDSTTFYELVLEYRPGHPEASEALAGRYRDEERWPDLIRLIRTRIEVTQSRAKNARDHSRLADILLVHCHDPAGAHHELLIAKELDDSIPLVYENLAEVEVTLGELDDALANWEFANSLHKRRNNSRARVLNLIRGGQACQNAGEHDTAEAWYWAALEIKPSSAAAMRGAASTAHQLGNHEEAATLWRKLVDADIEIPAIQGYYAGQLAKCLHAESQHAEAEQFLQQAVRLGGSRTKAEALLLQATTESELQNYQEAIDFYHQAIVALRQGENDAAYSQGDSHGQRKALTTAIALAKAVASEQLGNIDDAIADYELAFSTAAPQSIAKREAAIALLQHVPSGHGKLAWVDECIDGNTVSQDLLFLRIQRATILGNQGEFQVALQSLGEILSEAQDDECKRQALEAKAAVIGLGGAPAEKAAVLAQRATLEGTPLQRATAAIESAECWLDSGDYQRAMEAAANARDALVPLLSDPDNGIDLSVLCFRIFDSLSIAAWHKREWSTTNQAFTALNDLEDASALNREQVWRWGVALEKLGNLRAASERLEEVVSEDNDDFLSVQALQSLGQIYEGLDNFPVAASSEEALATSEYSELKTEERANAWYRAGILYTRSEQTMEKAKRTLDEALRCVPSHLPALDALEQIAKDENDHERLAVILGRKIAPLRQHPMRQRSLLERLALLQEKVLDRPDVAQATYQRILEITPQYRPALTFLQRRHQELGEVALDSELCIQLAGELPHDDTLAISAEDLQKERRTALLSLALLVQDTPPSQVDTCIALFIDGLAEEEEDQIWSALQKCYEQTGRISDLVDVIGQRLLHVDESEAAILALRQIEYLAHDLEDLGRALSALQVAQARHPDNQPLANWTPTLDREEGQSTTNAAAQSPLDTETSMYIALATEAVERQDYQQAYTNFEQAIARTPNTSSTYEKYADSAIAAGDFGVAVKQLETLTTLPKPVVGGSGFLTEQRGDLYLRLAELYYDKLSDTVLARRAMRCAADAFGPGLRRATTLRQLAIEAEALGADQDAISAYETMGMETLTDHEALTAAKLYQRLSKDHSAIDLLEAQQEVNLLSDEGRSLLLSLYRENSRQRELAQSLQAEQPEGSNRILCTRLLEALRIYDDVLADEDAASHVRESLRMLGFVDETRTGNEEIDNLVSAADASGGEERLVAVSLLARALEVACQRCKQSNTKLGEGDLELLDKLREMVGQAHLPEQDSATREIETLVRSLLLASSLSPSTAETISLLKEVAHLQRRELHDTRAAADALHRALALDPSNAEILSHLVPILQESGDYALLVRSYELHLSMLVAKDRSPALRDLGRIYQEVFRENSRAQECFDEADRYDTSPEQNPPVSSYQMNSNEITDELVKAAAQEALGNMDDARAIFESAAITAPRDPRSFQALRRIYQAQRESSKLARVLEQLTTLSDNPKEKAALFYQRANLARTEFHDDVLVYEYLKEAAANSPDEHKYSHALRTICMARGEWALAAELTYREIAAESQNDEKGALYLELALIFDEKLLDASQAVVNYEQALQLDPEIRAAPRPLARLYELAGRHSDAYHMYKRSAKLSPDPFEVGRLLRHAAMNAEQAGLTAEARDAYEKVAQSGSMQDAEAAVNAMDGIDGRTESDDQRPADRTGYDSSSYIDIDAMNARLQQESFQDPLARAQLFYELACAYQHDMHDLNAAVGAYEDALRTDPEHVQATDALADIAYKQRDWARAHSLYQEVPTTMSSLPPSIVAIRKGEIAELIGQEEIALEAFQVAQEFAPNNTEVLEGLVRCASRQGQHAQALSAQNSLVRAIPIDQVEHLSNARLHEAQICEKLENIEDTILAYESVVVEEHDSRAALSRLVPLYLEVDRMQEAAAALRSLIGITPSPVDRAGYLFQLGEIDRQEHSDPGIAADSYFKAIDLDPGHIGTLRRLLKFYCTVGDFLSATEMARDLEKQFALLKAETGLPLLHRAAIASELSGDHNLSKSICESFGSGALEEVARAVRETYRIGSPPSVAKLAPAILTLCQATGDNLEALCELLKSDALDEDLEYVAQLLVAIDAAAT